MHSYGSLRTRVFALGLLVFAVVAEVAAAGAAPTTATLQPSVNPLTGLTGEATIAGLYCFSVANCVAVGNDTNTEPFVLSGDPATWKPSQAKQIAVATGGSLKAVTCTSAADCIAVGETGSLEPLVLSGNPATWGPDQEQVIDFSGGGQLLAITCTSPTTCIAVGENHGGQPLRLMGNPSTWTTSNISVFALSSAFGGGGLFTSIACSSSTACVAGGSDYKGQPFTLSGDPATWMVARARQITLGSAMGSGGRVNSIACTSKTACIGVGTDNLGKAIGLIGNPATWNAHNVTSITNGASFSGAGNITSVACTSGTLCTVVGYDSDAQPYELTGNPRTWSAAKGTQLTMTRAFGSGGMLEAVECLSARTCVAVGNDLLNRPLSITIKPASWGANQVALSGAALGANATVTSLSCSSPASCVAVGYGIGSWPLFVQGSPSQWNLARASQFTFRNFTSFASVDCTSATYCVLVGNGSTSQPLVMTGDPATWKATDVRQLTLTKTFGSGGEFTGVSCTSSTWCVAVGSDRSGQPIALRGNPATWTGSQVTLFTLGAAFDKGGSFNAVTCATQSSCVAVGSDSADHVLVLSGNPATWSDADMKSFSLATALGATGDLNSIACTSTTSCVAVGGDGEKDPLVLVGDPATWGAAQAFSAGVPAPTTDTVGGYSTGGVDTNGSFASVSCSSSTQCVAVGGDGSGDPILIDGNPSTWEGQSIQRLAAGSSFYMASLGASECVGSVCYVAGRTTSGLYVAKL